MKVENLLNGNLFISKPDKQDKIGNDFKTILEEAKKREETLSALNIQNLNSSDLNSIKPKSDYIPQIEGILIGNKVLDKIEKYKKALENGEIPLRELQSLASSINEEINRIEYVSEKLPQSDPLKKILKEIEIVGIVEVIKCNQGKYI